MQYLDRLPVSGSQVQPYSSSLPSSSGGAASQTHTYRTGSPAAGSQPTKTPQPPWSSRMPPRCMPVHDNLVVIKYLLKRVLMLFGRQQEGNQSAVPCYLIGSELNLDITPGKVGQ